MTATARNYKFYENKELKSRQEVFSNWLSKCFKNEEGDCPDPVTVSCSAAETLPPQRKEQHMKSIMKRLWKEEEGQDLIEYALLVGLITLAAVALFPPIGTKINTIFTTINTCLGGGAC
jgi:pilus assembly protein Flp/PilA